MIKYRTPAPADRRGGVPDRGALLDVGGVAAQAVAGRAVADGAPCRQGGEVGRGQRERLLEPPAQLQVLAVRPRQAARLQRRQGRRDGGHHGGLRGHCGRNRRRFAPGLLLSLFGVPDRFIIFQMYLWLV